jgi:hypothetical protein
MKKTILFFLIFCTTKAFTQVSIGLRAGVGFSKLVESGPLANKAEADLVSDLSGINVAIPFEYKLSGRMSIQPELAFSQKGFEYVGGIGKTQLNYVELPLLLKFAFGQQDVKLNLLFGPSLGYAVSGANTFLGEKVKIDFADEDIKRFDIGMQAGLGASYPLSNGSIFLDARYILGFADLSTSTLNTINSRSYAFNIGYLYSLNKKEEKK